MSDNENRINNKTNRSGSKVWKFFSTIFKTIIILIIEGFIILNLSSWGSEIYIGNSSNRYYTSGWLYQEDLNPIYGVLGIIIYVLINGSGFFIFNSIISQLKNYNKTIGKIIFILFCVVINMIMFIQYSQLFGSYTFDIKLLEFFNNVIIRLGWFIFPSIFSVIYIYRKK